MVEKFSSVKSQSAALKQFMPRRMRDPQTLSPCPESTPYQGRSPSAEAAPRLIPPDYGLGSPRLAFSPPTTPQTGGPEAGRQAYRFSSSESSLTLRSGKESVLRNLRRQGQTVQTFLPTSNTLSSLRSVTPTPRGLVCRKSPAASASFSVAFRRRIKLSPPTTCSFAASGPLDRRPSQFSYTACGPHAGQFSASLSIILNKADYGFPLWWRTSFPPDLLDTTTQVCLPHHNTLLPLSHFFHKWECLPGFSAQFFPATHFSFGRNPPRFNGVHQTVLSSASKAFVLHQNFIPPTKWSNRGSTSVGRETRLFQPLLSCTKEGRWSTNHSGPASSEPLPLRREVQDVDVEDYYVLYSNGRLVFHCWPEGCLFSHSGRPVA